MKREELIARADKYLNTGSGEYASEIMRDMAEYIRRTPCTPAQRAPSREMVEKALCCPKGCVRDDDCFVSSPGARIRYTRSSREREQADAIMALYALTSTERCDGADDLEHLDGMLDDRERG